MTLSMDTDMSMNMDTDMSMDSSLNIFLMPMTGNWTMNDMRNEVVGHAHGISSIIHINLGQHCDCDQALCTMPYEDIYRTMTADKITGMRRAMLVNGVDMMGGRAFLVSSAHDEYIIDRTVAAFDESLNNLRHDGIL